MYGHHISDLDARFGAWHIFSWTYFFSPSVPLASLAAFSLAVFLASSTAFVAFCSALSPSFKDFLFSKHHISCLLSNQKSMADCKGKKKDEYIVRSITSQCEKKGAKGRNLHLKCYWTDKLSSTRWRGPSSKHQDSFVASLRKAARYRAMASPTMMPE